MKLIMKLEKGKPRVIFGSCEMPRHVLLFVLVSACNSATSTGGIFVKFLIPVLLKFVCVFLCQCKTYKTGRHFTWKPAYLCDKIWRSLYIILVFETVAEPEKKRLLCKHNNSAWSTVNLRLWDVEVFVRYGEFTVCVVYKTKRHV